MGSLELIDEAYNIARALNATDPRVGSARDNGTSTSALRITQGTNSASIAVLFMTFVPVAVYATVCITTFFVLRRKFPRVYAPRTFLNSLAPHERTPALPSGWFNWTTEFYKLPDTTVLNHSSLDGYLFLRYLKVVCIICGVGCALVWPVLIPVHILGGDGGKQLNLLTFGNVIHPSWYFIHAFLAWIFFGFVLYMVSRECVYFINLRQAYLLSPYYANRLSSRTVLFTCVPQQILDERVLRKVFGDAVRNVWIPRDTEELNQLVKEREQTAERLEKAEIDLISKANEQWRKAEKSGHPDIAPMEVTSGQACFENSEGETSPMGNPVSPLELPQPTPGQHRRVSYGFEEPDFENSIVVEVSALTPPQSPSSGQKEADFTVLGSQTSSASPREFTRADGTPGFKSSYGYDGPPPDINGSVAAQWIPHSWRPTHRPIANYGRSVDTIKWTRNQLKQLAPKISKLRRRQRKGQATPIPAAFIEFDSQANAQSAYQTLAHHRANHMFPDIVGLRPEEIVWPSLRMHWWERIVRDFMITGVITVMIIFWSLPCAAIGIISNVSLITEKVTFLSWVNDLPQVVLGLIEGLLPAVALSLLMSLVPIILRACARQAGVTTLSKVELFTQNSYFVFQVVQVFLVTTITSAASAAIVGILKDPSSAPTVLSANLPKASNFYVSYFILQGLAMSSSRIVHLGSLIRHQLLPYNGGKPRLITRKYHRLRVIHWGAIYPVFTNMAVIGPSELYQLCFPAQVFLAVTYSIIAPIILGFAFVGFVVIYTTYRYNILYVYSSELDTRGLHYPRALKQTLTGVYLAEICLVGLFALRTAFGPVVMMVGLILFTFLIHMSLSNALSPLLFNLPRTLAIEEELRRNGQPGLDLGEDKGEAVPDVEDPEHQTQTQQAQDYGYDSDFDPSAPAGTIHDPAPAARTLEGADKALNITKLSFTTYLQLKFNKSPLPTLIQKLDFWSYWITPDPSIKPNFLLKFLHPETFADYSVLRNQVPESWRNGEVEITYEEGAVRDAYCVPSMRKRAPRLILPRDPAGVSKQEVDHSGKVVQITDEGAWLDKEGKLVVDLELDRREEWEKMRY